MCSPEAQERLSEAGEGRAAVVAMPRMTGGDSSTFGLCGDAVVPEVDVQRDGARLAFANCYLCCGERRVAHASAVFANTSR
jgi:hypothetical protein